MLPLTELITHKGLCQCLHFAFIFPLQSAVNGDEERLITAVYNTLQLPYVFLFLENSQVVFCHLNECTFLDVVSYTERYMNKSIVNFYKPTPKMPTNHKTNGDEIREG